MKKFYVIGLILSAAFCTVLSSCQSMDSARLMSAVQKSTQAMSITNAQVAQYVAQSVKQMDAQNKVAPANSSYTQRLNNLTKGITSVNGTPLNFKVYLTNQVNAFACADGSVRVYSGIMDMMDDDELIGIIGHEIGHVAMEHSKEAFKQAIINSALIDAVGATSSTAAALTQSQLGQLAQSLMSAKYSRKQENQADNYGYDFLKQHGRNPYNMVKAFQKMQKLEQQGNGATQGSSLSNMFSDHPQTSERIKNMTQRCIKDGYIRK